MSELKELEMRIRKLPSNDFAQLREWFHDYENELWDRQIERDYRSGKLGQLIEKAAKEFNEGKVYKL